MRILISGSHGLVGTPLVDRFRTGGRDVVRLVRQRVAGDDSSVSWDPVRGTIDRPSLDGLDAVVHLAGENIATRRWTFAQKTRIRDSRVNGTRLLAETLAAQNHPPRVLICASAIGYYGDRVNEELDERSACGCGFLAEVCREWEAACEPAAAAGIRVVPIRFGMILTADGGALRKMLPPFRLGLGGIVGSGRQYWSWITRDDVLGIIEHVIQDDQLAGPVNGTSPDPVTNHQFTKALGRVLHRPTLFPMPAFAARLILGGMADELLLASARVLPQRLLETGYEFRHRSLNEALTDILNRRDKTQS